MIKKMIIIRIIFKENELKARTNQVEVLRIKNTTLNHEMGKVSLKAQQQAETGILPRIKQKQVYCLELIRNRYIA